MLLRPLRSVPRTLRPATTDQNDPGSRVLYKDMKLARGMKHTLSFYLYYDNRAEDFSPRSTLDPNKLAPPRRTFNLTPFAARTVRLRFAEVDNRDYLLASVDAVKVTSKKR